MNKLNSKTFYALSAVLVLAAAQPLSAHAEYRCEAPQAGIDARACAIAAQGPTELRRFVLRTRMIYGLHYWDFRQPETNALAALPSSERTVAAMSPSHLADRATTQ